MSKTLSSLSIGDKIKVGSLYGRPVEWIVAAGEGFFGEGKITLLSERIIKLLAFDASEASFPDFYIRNFGNGKYIPSNIRSWLNSDAGPGEWYSGKHAYDCPPSVIGVSTNAYNEDAGFLNGFTEAEKAALAPAPIVVDVDGEPTLPDKIYLLSAIDAGAAIGAGEAIPFLADENNRIALPTAEAVSHSNFTDVFLSDTRGWYWWTRTMLFPGGFRIRTINPNGRSGAEYANCGHVGLRPACNLSSNQAVSEEKDSDGAYALE